MKIAKLKKLLLVYKTDLDLVSGVWTLSQFPE